MTIRYRPAMFQCRQTCEMCNVTKATDRVYTHWGWRFCCEACAAEYAVRPKEQKP